MPIEKPSTIRDWQNMFANIYGNVNSNLTPEEIWLHLMEEAGEVAKDMRKENFNTLALNLPDVFAWLCSFANRIGIDLEDAVWSKYPRVCPYCLRTKYCICISEGYDTFDPARLVNFKRQKERPSTFNQWYAMFKDIYGNVNRVLSRASIGFHLMEEIGEVASTVRLDNHQDYGMEIADVFAWLIALTMKIPEIGGLDEITWQIFPGHCKRCHKATCECEGKQRQPRL